MIWWQGGPEQTHFDGALLGEMLEDSDRAAALVGGAAVEKRLEDAIKDSLSNDANLRNELFQPGGALGAFKPKVTLARLMGLITDEAYGELKTIIEVRNDFAHKLTVFKFEPAYAAKCQKLTLVDRWVSEPDPSVLDRIQAGDTDIPKGRTPYQMGGVAKVLATARGRYVWTCCIFNMEIGRGLHAGTAPPYI